MARRATNCSTPPCKENGPIVVFGLVDNRPSRVSIFSCVRLSHTCRATRSLLPFCDRFLLRSERESNPRVLICNQPPCLSTITPYLVKTLRPLQIPAPLFSEPFQAGPLLRTSQHPPLHPYQDSFWGTGVFYRQPYSFCQEDRLLFSYSPP